MKNKVTIPIFVPHRGCPNDCIFCNQRKITGVVQEMTPEQAERLIHEYLAFGRKDMEFEIAFFGGSFTAIEECKRRKLLKKAVECIRQFPQIKHIRVSTRPDAINDDILEELKENFVKIIELGVQSLDEDVLAASNRGHGVSCVYNSVEKIKQRGFQLGLQMMTGLPKDSFKKSLATAKKFVELRPDIVRIYPVLVIQDTALAMQMNRGEFQIWSLEETVELVKKIKVLFDFHGIEVIRMGLQPTETIQMGVSVLAGPFHPSFGELIYSRMYRDFLENYLLENGFLYQDGIQRMEISVNSGQISKWVGNRRSTLSYFKETYGMEFRFRAKEVDGAVIEDLNFTSRQITEYLYHLYLLKLKNKN